MGENITITAPKIKAQKEVLIAALRSAGIKPEDISYVETRGTGTSLGDPIEFEGLNQVFDSRQLNFCGIGSVKTNIGHLEASAGMAGLIKVILMLKHQQLVPSLNFRTINPLIPLDDSLFYLTRKHG